MDENRLKKLIFVVYFPVYFIWKIFAPQNINDFGSSLILLSGIAFTAVKIFKISKKSKDYKAYSLILATALFLYTLGDASWILYEIKTRSSVPIYHISTLFYVVESILVGVALWSLIIKKSTRWNRLKYGVDGIFSAIFIFYIAWKLVFRHINPNVISNPFEVNVLLIYVTVDFFVILGASILCNSKIGDKIDKVVAAVLILWSFTDIVYYWILLTDKYSDSSMVDIFWVFTFFVLWYASEYRVEINKTQIIKLNDSECVNDSSTETPISLVILFFSSFILSYDDLFMMIVFVIMLILRKIASKFIHTYLVNEYLTKEYKKLNEILEEKVIERTEELKIKNEELYILANIDALTGLPNRRHFLEYLEYKISVNPKDKLMALLFIDLDRFKSINDWYGHEIGDKLLLNVAERLKNNLPPDSFIARLGGDEFVVVLNNILKGEDAKIAAMKFVEAFRIHFKIGDSKINSTVSVGISIYPSNSNDISSLLKAADIALYCAKEQGKNIALLYDSSMKKEEKLKLELESYLYDSIKNKELKIEYRPQINPNDGNVVGFDSRIYWDSAVFGRTEYSSFKVVAEDSGFIMDIGIWTLRQICSNIRYLCQKCNKKIRFSVEISTNQFLGSDIVSILSDYIKEYEIDGKFLELEILENFSSKDEDIVIEKLNGLKNLGIIISIIDFGMGYSSLKYLKSYPIDNIKIPSSITKDVVSDIEVQKLVKVVVSLSNIFELKSIAQGVQNIEQSEILMELGCDEVRGSYYGKFVSFEDIEKMVGI